jgi:hypothetical protein
LAHLSTRESSGRRLLRREASPTWRTDPFKGSNGVIDAGMLFFQGRHHTSYIHDILSEN